MRPFCSSVTSFSSSLLITLFVSSNYINNHNSIFVCFLFTYQLSFTFSVWSISCDSLHSIRTRLLLQRRKRKRWAVKERQRKQLICLSVQLQNSVYVPFSLPFPSKGPLLFSALSSIRLGLCLCCCCYLFIFSFSLLLFTFYFGQSSFYAIQFLFFFSCCVLTLSSPAVTVFVVIHLLWLLLVLLLFLCLLLMLSVVCVVVVVVRSCFVPLGLSTMHAVLLPTHVAHSLKLLLVQSKHDIECPTLLRAQGYHPLLRISSSARISMIMSVSSSVLCSSSLLLIFQSCEFCSLWLAVLNFPSLRYHRSWGVTVSSSPIMFYCQRSC